MAKDPADELREDLHEFIAECRILGRESYEVRIGLETRIKELEVKMKLLVMAFGAVALAILGVIVDRLSKGH